MAVEDKYKSVADFLVFIGVMGMISQFVLVVVRFLNVSIINQHFTIFGILVGN